MKFVTMLFLLIAALPGSSTATSSGVMGDWVGPTQSIVHIYPCGGTVCVKISRLSSTAPDKLDAKNPNEDLRSRPLCGLDIGTDFHQVDASHLDKGHLYDPESGKTYNGTIVANGDQLSLRGYIGISLLGRTEIWHRVPAADDKRCN